MTPIHTKKNNKKSMLINEYVLMIPFYTKNNHIKKVYPQNSHTKRIHKPYSY